MWWVNLEALGSAQSSQKIEKSKKKCGQKKQKKKQKFGVQKMGKKTISNSKSVLPKMSARSGLVGKKSSRPRLGPSEAIFSMDRKNAKNVKILPIFLGGGPCSLLPKACCPWRHAIGSWRGSHGIALTDLMWAVP